MPQELRPLYKKRRFWIVVAVVVVGLALGVGLGVGLRGRNGSGRNLPSTLSSSSASSATPTQTPSPAELDYEVPTGQWLVNAPYAGIRGSCASRVLNEWFYLIYNCFPYFEDTLAVTETSLGRSYSLAGTFPVEYSEIVGSPPTQSLRYWTFAENFTHAVSGIGNAPGTDHEGTCEASMALKWALGNNKQEIAITWTSTILKGCTIMGETISAPEVCECSYLSENLSRRG